MPTRFFKPPRRFSRPNFWPSFERLELISRKIFRGRMKGERRSKRKGQSVEFADFRSYVPGDDLRFIDWNTYARLDRLFLKMFLEEEDLHFYALIDASASMDFGEPDEAALCQAIGGGAGFHRFDAGRPSADRNARPAGAASGAGAAWPAKPAANDRLARRDRAGRKSFAGRWGQEFLPPQFRQGHFGVADRLDGQAGLRSRPCAICWPSRWTCT